MPRLYMYVLCVHFYFDFNYICIKAITRYQQKSLKYLLCMNRCLVMHWCLFSYLWIMLIVRNVKDQKGLVIQKVRETVLSYPLGCSGVMVGFLQCNQRVTGSNLTLITVQWSWASSSPLTVCKATRNNLTYLLPEWQKLIWPALGYRTHHHLFMAPLVSIIIFRNIYIIISC